MTIKKIIWRWQHQVWKITALQVGPADYQQTQNQSTFFSSLQRFLKTRPGKILAGLNGLILIISIGITLKIFAPGANSAAGDSAQLDINLPGTAQNRALPAQASEINNLSILLLGYGGPGHQGGMLTDVIQLANFDLNQGQITLISLPRDLWVTLPNGQADKINEAFTLGNSDQPIISGGQVAKEMVSIVTGLPVDYFVSVDFVGFKRLIGEVLAGVEVQVTETLDDPWYPITGEEQNTCGKSADEVAQLSAQYSGFELEKQFTCRYEHLHFEPGTVKMQGSEALAFARSRHGSAGGDFSRSQRQQQVLVGIKNKLWSLDLVNQAPQLFQTASYTFHSDLNLELVTKLSPLLTKISDLKLVTVNLSSENVFQSSQSPTGQYILLPKDTSQGWKSVHNYLQTYLPPNR